MEREEGPSTRARRALEHLKEEKGDRSADKPSLAPSLAAEDVVRGEVVVVDVRFGAPVEVEGGFRESCWRWLRAS